jgi:hypothetical protein
MFLKQTVPEKCHRIVFVVKSLGGTDLDVLREVAFKG